MCVYKIIYTFGHLPQPPYPPLVSFFQKKRFAPFDPSCHYSPASSADNLLRRWLVASHP